ncbi:sigma 54-interacting transcriptional regulator [Spiribacter sp. 221]|uniref:sigma-54-dependent Fis family transcriptional regulator n=1 Tax=Spiribacter onubensis TaxID=3122420 RepID=UPI00349F5906
MVVQTQELSRARQYLERRGRVSSSSLPPDIADSWQRCVDLGLDPLGKVRMPNLDSGSLRDACDAHEQLIRYARPEIELLYDQIAGSNFMIALGSPDGLILQTLVDQQFADNAAAHTVVPGSTWTESVRGTNALGIALKTGRPAHVYGQEHYLRANAGVSCICAPIFDGHGAIAGLLDASTTAAHRQEHTAALLQMSAGNIENCLIRSRFEDQLVLLFHPRPEYLDTLSVGVLVLDGDHRIAAFNRRGGIFLAGLSELIGKPFSAVFEEGLESLAGRLGRGETIRVRDRFGSAASMRCLPNRASFALSALSAPSAEISLDGGGPSAGTQPALVLEDPTLAERATGLPQAAHSGMPICLEGETGTGKTALATFIHASSGREGPWVSLQPGDGIGPEIESQVRGGTLYLDAVNDLSMADQEALLRLLERLDGDTLIISASTASAQHLIDQGRIRPELAYRLAGFVVVIPPLRDRDDLIELTDHFLAEIRPGLTIDSAGIDRLRAHDWPGNLHELRTRLTRAAVKTSGFRLTAADFPDIGGTPDAPVSADRIAEVLLKLTDNGLKWRDVHGQTIRLMVDQCEGNVAEAARRLGLSRTTVYKYLQ